MKLTIHHYADMMNLYGDRGNVISMRCEWRGVPVEVDVGLGESIEPTGCDVFLFGGGQDREQALAGDLSVQGRRPAGYRRGRGRRPGGLRRLPAHGPLLRDPDGQKLLGSASSTSTPSRASPTRSV